MPVVPVPIKNQPAHVPAELAFDFDMYELPQSYGGETHRYWKDVQMSYPPLFWTPHHGGHWVATRGDDIKYMLETHGEFSNRESFIPKGVQPPIIPPTLDPPEHTPVRALIQPAFTPKAIQKVHEHARHVAIEIIDKLQPKGGCEFVGEFAGVMPVSAFLSMLQLPPEDGPMLRGYSELSIQRKPEGWTLMTEYVKKVIDQRRNHPGDDIVSRVTQGQLNGRPITDHEVLSICQVLIGGGLDTVVTMTSFIAWYLADHPEDRKTLRENPDLIPGAVEEFARRFGTTNIGREVNKDLVYRGVEMRKGDMVCVCTPLYGLDDSLYPDSLAVNIRRQPPARHMAFGSGVHNCAGAGLACREMAIFIDEWLKRIPDFRIKVGTTPVVSTGLVNSMSEMWLEW